MENINFIVVFLEGVLSFLSPCVLPILPIYLAVLSTSSGEKEVNENSKQARLFSNTMLFVLGIATTFFILGTGIGLFRTFIMTYNRYFLMGGGIFIMIMGLFYIGDLKLPFLQKERRIHYQVKQMNPIVAYLLGFTFSFGWTPCIGPMLASVLVLASTSQNALTGNLLIAIYTLGFVIPFMIVALFSKKMMKLLDKIKLQSQKIQKIGGYILMLMGLLVFVNGVRTPNFVKPATDEESIKSEVTQEQEQKQEAILAPDFTLVDQQGVSHTLSDYKGKTVFMTFWGTWCKYCQQELPYLDEVYEEYGNNEEDVVILGIAFPNTGKEKSVQGITEFLEQHDYTFPTVFDEAGDLSYYYGISSFPTTFVINSLGEVEGYLQGAMNKDMMKEIIEQVKSKYE
ncbi:MAG: cytochrome c biogenesis protein CcdA [Turicibacter sp.]